MNPPRRRTGSDGSPVVGWLLWPALLAVATAVLLAIRSQLNEAQVALTFLLIVQLAAARHGRTLGLSLAAVAFVVFDVLFLPPFGTLVVSKAVDWVVLGVFLVSCVVTAQLFERSRREATEARTRAEELDRLSMLGAETLNAPRAEDALMAICTVIRSSLDLDRCGIWQLTGEATVSEMVAAGRREPHAASPTVSSMVRRVAETGRLVGVRGDIGRALVTDTPVEPLGAGLREAALPLQVRGRLVGVLVISREADLDADASHARMLEVLSYYAALGVERVGLAARAEHADSLREAARTKDAVLASVSHDLRTPLTTIKALAHELAEGGEERAVIIEEEANRLNQFVADLLDLSRLNAGVPLVPEPNEAEDLIGVALQRLGGTAGAGRVDVAIDGGEVLLLGRFDFGQTLRALVNLLENAVKYSPADGRVELSAGRERNELVFRVGDRGPGIPDGEREQVFEPFFRSRSAAPDAGGSGLGLSIARAIARGQGGELTYQPRPGGGSLFVLRVPFVEATALDAP